MIAKFHHADHAMQADLLKLRWVTVPLLQEARRRWLTKSFSLLKPEQIAFRYRDRKRHFLSTHPKYEDSTNWPDTLDAVLDNDEYLFTLPHSAAIESARPFDDDGEPQLCRGMLVYEMLSRDLDGTTLPPEHALKGPWTEDKLLYLFWLAWAGCSLEFAGSTILPEVSQTSHLVFLPILTCCTGCKPRAAGCHSGRQPFSHLLSPAHWNLPFSP